MPPVNDSSASCSPYPLALEGGKRWYVAHTQPQREAQAAQQLGNQDYHVFLPRILKSRRHARKFETVLAPLFPRYLFIALDLGRDRWRSVNGTYGVDRLLMRAGEPEPVPRGLVEQLIEAAANDDEGVVRCGPALKEGQSIRVTAGPFAELIGTLDRLDDQGRVRVLLEIMGGTVPVVLSGTIVAPS
jgi:transcription elongation factor/antiterminator RfaH